MSKRELEQVKVFERLKRREISQKEAGLVLDLSTRWIRTKFKRYRNHGDRGLVHGNRGNVSGRKWSRDEKARAMVLLKSEWRGFGPTFAAEKLEELEAITVSKETLRSAMIEEGIWHAKRLKLKHRKRRERRPTVGSLVQLDGSPHDWFEGRAPACTLLVFIDDATSKILWLEFATSESVVDVMKATKQYMLIHGRPCVFYVDFGSVFSVNTNNKERDKKTQWERVLDELNVKVQHAHSPQAKGRVERSNGTHQDRLIKEMRLAGVSSIEQANAFLQESGYIERHNKKFAVKPAQSGNAHRLIEGYDLDTVFCIREHRTLANDFTITFNKRIFQLDAQQKTIIRPKDVITINAHLNGGITLSIRKTMLYYTEVNKRKPKPHIEKEVTLKPYRKPSRNSRLWAGGHLPGRVDNEAGIAGRGGE